VSEQIAVPGVFRYHKTIEFNLFSVDVFIPRKRRANFKPHMRRRLKAISRGR